MIKKIITIISLILSFSSNIYGYDDDELLKNNNYTLAGRRKIYLKLNVGAGLLNETSDRASSLKMKSKSTPYLAIGAGTYFMDNTRVDITFEHAQNPHLKKSTTGTFNNLIGTNIGNIVINDRLLKDNGILSAASLTKLGFSDTEIPVAQKILSTAFNNLKSSANVNNISESIIQASINLTTQIGGTTSQGRNNALAVIRRLNALQNENDPAMQDLYYLLTQNLNTVSLSTKVDHKSSINSFMVNGYFDLYEFNKVKIFLGGGVGCAQLREKISITSILNLNDKNNVIIDQAKSTAKANNFAYSLTLGTSAQVSEQIAFEVAYSWKDFGRTKSLKFKGMEIGKTPYRSHTLTGGIRVNI